MGFAQAQKHPRVRVQTKVAVRFARDHVVDLCTENISRGGMFVRSAQLPEPGAQLMVRLCTPFGTLTTRARVVHTMDEQMAERKAHPPGLGLQFDDLSQHAATTLEKFLRSEDAGQPQVEPWTARAIRQLGDAGTTLLQRLRKLGTPADALAGDHQDATPWYHRVSTTPVAARTGGEDAGGQAVVLQLRDLLTIAQEHEQKGEAEEAEQVLCCARELIKSHPRLTVMMEALETRPPLEDLH